MSFASGALSIIPLKAPIPVHPMITHIVIKATNRTLIKETCALFPIMAVREISEFRFFETDFFP